MSNLETKIDTLTGSMSAVAASVARVEGWCKGHDEVHTHIDKALDRIDGDTRENTRSLATKRGKDSDAPAKPVNRWQAFGQALAAVPLRVYMLIGAVVFAVCMSVSAKVSNGSTATEIVNAVHDERQDLLAMVHAIMDAFDATADAVETLAADHAPAPEPVADEPPPEEEP